MFRQEEKGKVVTEVKKIALATQLPKQWPSDGRSARLTAGFSEYKDAVSLAHTCRFLYHGTKGAVDELKQKALAQCIVVEPNTVKVTAILEQDPKLINAAIKEINDNSDRILINNTILQLAYGAGNAEMCLAIKPFFVKVYGSEEVAIREMKCQLAEKFGGNKEEDKKKDEQTTEYLGTLLAPVLAAMPLSNLIFVEIGLITTS